MKIVNIFASRSPQRRWHVSQRRRRAGLAMLTGYSRFVGMMKLALPATAVALLGLLIVWPKLAPRDEEFRVAFANFKATQGIDTQSMVNPRYFGTDDKNQPFTVTAELGTQVDQELQAVSMDRPVAHLDKRDGGSMVINSDLGVFQQKANTLDLYGHVDLYQDKGYEVHSDSAHIDVGTRDGFGEEPTHGWGPAGVIDGEGFRLWDGGSRIMFTGKAKAVLNMSKSQ
jgi:lipopolysaccharide export system protein LptC